MPALRLRGPRGARHPRASARLTPSVTFARQNERRVSGESRVLILRLALRAIRWRAAASAAVFVVAVVAILAATVGPIYLHAVDETVLARHLNDASVFQRDVVVSRDSESGFPRVDWAAQVRSLAGEVAHDHLFTRPVFEQQVDVVYGGADQLKTEIASIENLCPHVRIVRGRCLSGNSTSQTLISANTAAAEHLTVGDTLATTSSTGVAIPLRVVGVYRPVAPAGSFWELWDLFQFGQPGQENAAPPGDASFVTSAALTSRLERVPETLSANVALLPGACALRRHRRAAYDDRARECHCRAPHLPGRDDRRVGRRRDHQPADHP